MFPLFAMAGMSVCYQDLFGYANFIDWSISLYNFMAGICSVNPGFKCTDGGGY